MLNSLPSFQLWTISAVCGENKPDVELFKAHSHHVDLVRIGKLKSAEYSELKGIQSIGSVIIELTEEELNDPNILYEMHAKLGTWQSQFMSISGLTVFGRYPEGFFDIFYQLLVTKAVDLTHYEGDGFPFEETINLEKISVSGRTLENLDGLWTRTTLKHLTLDIIVKAMAKYSAKISRSIQENELETLKLNHCGVEEYKAICEKPPSQKFDIKFKGHEIKSHVTDGIRFCDFHFPNGFGLSEDELNSLPSAQHITGRGVINEESLKPIWLYFTGTSRTVVNIVKLIVDGEQCSLSLIFNMMRLKKMQDYSVSGDTRIDLLQVNFTKSDLTNGNYTWLLGQLRKGYNVAAIEFHIENKEPRKYVFDVLAAEVKETILKNSPQDEDTVFGKVNSKIVRELNEAVGIVVDDASAKTARAKLGGLFSLGTFGIKK